MIRYALICCNEHDFEAWFSNSTAYDEQVGKGLVTCPQCGTEKVSKALMAPSISRGDSAPGAFRDVVELMRKAREYVVKNSDYVGSEFASEARKIHNEEAEPRAIYGEATTDEARELTDEGVDFHPLPVLPEDHN